MQLQILARNFSLAATLALLGTASHAAAILLIDDDQGQSGTSTWTSTLAALGHTVTVESISANGSPVTNFSGYQAVIWSNGDAAYSNLTAANVTSLTAYLNGGGRLLYGGGHSVYEENFAQSFIQNYLGLKNYQYTMPTFGNCGSSASASGSLGNVGLNCMSTGFYNDMMSGFDAGLSTASELLELNPGNISPSGVAIAAINTTDTYRAMTWGFDLNHVAAGQRAALLDSALDLLLDPGTAVPEPGSLALLGLGLAGIAAFRRRRT